MRFLAFLLIPCLLEACDGRPQGVEQEALAHKAVLGHLQTRSERLIIHSTREGPRFSIRSAAGKVLAEGLSLDELKARHPEMWRTYRDSLAGRPLDATLDVDAPSRRPARE